LKRVFDLAAALAAGCIVLIFLIMIAAALGRVLGLRTGGADDIVSWLCAASAFLAMAHSFRRGDFVRMELIIGNLSVGKRRIVEFVALSIALLFCTWAAWWCTRSVIESWEFGDMANGLIAVPLWIPQCPVALGAALLALAVAEQWALVVLDQRRPDYVTGVEERHAAGDFSSEV